MCSYRNLQDKLVETVRSGGAGVKWPAPPLGSKGCGLDLDVRPGVGTRSGDGDDRGFAGCQHGLPPFVRI